MKLTNKQQWFLHLLIEKKRESNDFFSPTHLGDEFKKAFHLKSGGSMCASNTLLTLTKIGLIERNYKGHYRAL